MNGFYTLAYLLSQKCSYDLVPMNLKTRVVLMSQTTESEEARHATRDYATEFCTWLLRLSIK